MSFVNGSVFTFSERTRTHAAQLTSTFLKSYFTFTETARANIHKAAFK